MSPWRPYSQCSVSDDLAVLAMMLAAVGLVLLIQLRRNPHPADALARRVQRAAAKLTSNGAGRHPRRLIRRFLTESACCRLAAACGSRFSYVMMTAMETLLRNQPLNPSFVPCWIPAEATMASAAGYELFHAGRLDRERHRIQDRAGVACLAAGEGMELID